MRAERAYNRFIHSAVQYTRDFATMSVLPPMRAFDTMANHNLGLGRSLFMDIPKSWAPLVGVLEYASTMTLLHLKKMHYVNGVFVYNATCSVGSHDHFENKAQRKKTLLKGSMSLLWCSGFPREMCHGYIWKYQLHSRIFWLLLLVDLDA